MANPLRGELEFKAGDKTYTLCFPSNRVVEVETLLGGQDIGNIAVSLAQRPSYSVIRALMWGALQEKHPDVDLIAAGNIMDDFDGGLEGLIDPIGRALRFRLSRIPVDEPLGKEQPAAE